MSKVETLEHLREIVGRVTYPGFTFRTDRMDDGFFVQIQYREVDVDTGKLADQHGRKWYVSKHATVSEAVQTMLKAAITSAEHRVREHFLVDGVRAFGPHMSVDQLVAAARAGRDKRAPK